MRAVLTRIQRAHAASTRQQSANLPLLQNPTGLFEENLRVFNCRPLSATAGDQRFLLLDHSVDLLPRHSCEPFSWRLVVRRNVVGSVNVDIDACRFLHDTPPFQSALSSSPRTTRFSHSLYPHRRAWIVVHSEQEPRLAAAASLSPLYVLDHQPIRHRVPNFRARGSFQAATAVLMDLGNLISFLSSSGALSNASQ